MAAPKPYYRDRRRGVALYHGDCVEIVPRLAPPGMVLTDPPYRFARMSRCGLGGRDCYNGGLAGMTDGDPLLMAAVLTAAPVAVVFHSRDQVGTLHRVLAARYRRYDLHVWHKTDAPPFSHNAWKPDVEYIALGYDRAAHRHHDPRRKSKVYTSGTVPVSRKNHPCSKPIPLLCKYLAVFGPSSVLDPFCGGGAVLMAARELGITAVGIEKEERWCEAAARWLDTGKTSDWRVTSGLRKAAA